MQLEDIEEGREGRESEGKSPKKQQQGGLAVNNGDGNQQQKGSSSSSDQRRGSHLLAAAGIDYERRRKHSFQNSDSRIYQDGNEMVMEDKDGKVTRLEILEVHEKMGMLRKAVPTLPIFIAILLCFLNTFIPGAGTLLGAASLLCCGKCRHEKTVTGIKYGVLAAVLQMLTAVLVIGWIYSIIYGVQMIQDAITRSAISPETPSQEEEKTPSETKQSQAWA